MVSCGSNANFGVVTCSEIYNGEESITIKPKRNISHYMPKNFGHSYSPSYDIKIGVHIPLTKNNDGILKELIIDVKKSIIYDMNKKKSIHNDNDKFAPFLINVYEFDLKNKQFINKFFVEDTLISLKKNEKKIRLNLEQYKIPFSENGLFITIEKLSKKKYEELGFVNGPSFGIVGVSKRNIISPYYLNNRYESQWQDYKFLIERNNTFDINFVISRKKLKAN
jgi:hypothetical protein